MRCGHGYNVWSVEWQQLVYRLASKSKSAWTTTITYFGCEEIGITSSTTVGHNVARIDVGRVLLTASLLGSGDGALSSVAIAEIAVADTVMRTRASTSGRGVLVVVGCTATTSSSRWGDTSLGGKAGRSTGWGGRVIPHVWWQRVKWLTECTLAWRIADAGYCGQSIRGGSGLTLGG